MTRQLKVGLLVGAAMALLCFAGCKTCAAGDLDASKTPATIRTPGAVTGTRTVATGTTFSMPSTAVATHAYGNWAGGAATSVSIAPAGARTGNPAGGFYHVNLAKEQTITTTGPFDIRIPREEFPGPTYNGYAVLGNGTITSTSLELGIKHEYR